MDAIRDLKKYTCDVLVVGGGMAGCFAAIKARQKGADVILIDKGYVGKSGQSPYAGSFMVFNPQWGMTLGPGWNKLTGSANT